MKKPTTDSKISSSRSSVPTSKLRLARETLRRLTARELRAVAGGTEDTRTCTCTTDDDDAIGP